jgi:alpha-beta hydrolase superfamily lysophospholipase
MITTTYTSLKTADNTLLHVTDFLPNGRACNRILLMHGLGEHSGRYQHVAEFFCARGFAVRTYDHRGHGKSGGARGDVPNETALLDDAAAVMRDWGSQPDSPEAPPFLLGHSMGGLFAARFAVAGIAPLSGLILSSPALALPLSAPQKLLLKILTAVAPGIAVSNGLKRRYLSHDSKVIQAYSQDPLVHSKITARLLNAMLAAIFITQRDAAQLRMPTLLVFAGDDHLVDPDGSEQLAKKLLPGILTRHRYNALYHEIFNENKPDAVAVFNDVSRWLNEQFSIDI